MAKYVYITGAGYSRSSYPDFETYTKYYEQYGYQFEVARTITGDPTEIHKGSPLTNDLLKDAMSLDIDQLTLTPIEKSTYLKSRAIVNDWLLSLHLDDIATVKIQDVLTYLDMSISKDLENRSRLGRIKFAIANILSILLYVRLGHGTQQLDLEFIQHLQDKLDHLRMQGERDNEIIIIDLNWDLVLDNALKSVFGSSQYDIEAMSGKFLNKKIFASSEYTRDESTGIKLIKPHGSLNWLWCLGCEKLIIFEGETITRYILPFADDEDEIICSNCGKDQFEPVIITPSLYRNIFLVSDGFVSAIQQTTSKIWENMRENLMGLTHLSIIGYSLPGEDKELRYYLRNAILESDEFRGVTVVTGSPKPAPTNQEIVSEEYLQRITQGREWDNYVSFFGAELSVSLEANPLNFWTFGFFEYFRRFVKHGTLSHAEAEIRDIIASLDF